MQMDDKDIYGRATAQTVHHLHPMVDHCNINKYISYMLTATSRLGHSQCCAPLEGARQKSSVVSYSQRANVSNYTKYKIPYTILFNTALCNGGSSK